MPVKINSRICYRAAVVYRMEGVGKSTLLR